MLNLWKVDNFAGKFSSKKQISGYHWYLSLQIRYSVQTNADKVYWQGYNVYRSVVVSPGHTAFTLKPTQQAFPGTNIHISNKEVSAWSKTVIITVRRKCISKPFVLFQKFSIGSRSSIINDAFNLARAGLLKQVTAFNLTRYIKAERDYVPWKTIGDVTSYIGDMLSKTRAYGYFQVRDFIDSTKKSSCECKYKVEKENFGWDWAIFRYWKYM